MRRVLTTAAVTLTLAAAGCASSTSSTGAGGPGGSSPASPSTPISAGASPDCPVRADTSFAWPAGVPGDLPKPPGAHLTGSQRGSSGQVLVTLDVPTSLRDGVRFLATQLPSAGFTLGQGDSEADEADIPFSRAGISASVKLSALERCRTRWTLIVTGGTSAPD